MKKSHQISLIVYVLVVVAISHTVRKTGDPLPSWNSGKNKQAIIAFVNAVSDSHSSQFIPLEERIAAFAKDGTL